MFETTFLEIRPVTLREWALTPELLALLALLAGVFALLLVKTPRELGTHEAIGPRQFLAVGAACVLLFLALGSPLDAAASRLFSLHMLQHTILSGWVPPLLLLGLTPAMVQNVLARRSLFRVVRFLTQPLVAAPIFILNMWFWHAPPIYDAAAVREGLDSFMHLTFLVTGLLFWWSVVNPLPGLHSLSTGWRALYVILADLPMMFMAFLFVASQTVLFNAYALQPRLWDISLMTDQQLGGAVMGALGEVTLFIPFTRFFIQFMNQDDTPVSTNGLESAVERSLSHRP